MNTKNYFSLFKNQNMSDKKKFFVYFATERNALLMNNIRKKYKIEKKS